MKCTEFAAKVIQAREARRKQAAEAAAAKRQREAELRQQHLASIRQRADTSAYDQVAAQLRELRDAYAQAGDLGAFQQKLSGFRLRYSSRPAMLRRIEKL